FALSIAIAIIAAVNLSQQQATPVLQTMEPVAVPSPPAAQAEPTIRYPIQEETASKTLPALEESDPAMWDALVGMVEQKTIKSLLYPQGIVRHIVVTIDNLPRKMVAVRLLPAKPVGGKFRTTGNGENLAIDRENAARYTPYVRL